MAIVLSLVSGAVVGVTLAAASSLAPPVALLAAFIVFVAVYFATSSSSTSSQQAAAAGSGSKSSGVAHSGKKNKKDKKSSSSTGGDGASEKEKDKEKGKKKTSAPPPPPPQPEPEDEEEEEQEQDEEEDQELDSAESGKSLSKNARKKQKKREAERKKKEEEEKKRQEEEAKRKAEEKKKADAAKKAAKAGKATANTNTISTPPAAATAASSNQTQQATSSAVKQSKAQQQQSQTSDVNHHQPNKSKGQQVAQQPTSTSVSGASDDGWEVVQAENRPSAAQRSKAAAAAAAAAASNAGAAKDALDSSSADRQVAVEISVPTKSHATLIGTKGATLKSLSEATQVEIQMPKRDSGDTRVILKGTAANVAACRGAIEALISKGYSTITHPGYVHDDINIPEDRMAEVIGRKGHNIVAISNKTGTQILIPKVRGSGEKVIITGPKDKVKEARNALRQLMNEGYTPYTHEGQERIEIDFPQDKLGWLVGKGGQTIKSIKGNTKCDIWIPKGPNANGEFKVGIIGPPDNIAQAQKEILRLLEPKEVPTEADEESLEPENNPYQEQVAYSEDSLW